MLHAADAARIIVLSKNVFADCIRNTDIVIVPESNDFAAQSMLANFY